MLGVPMHSSHKLLNYFILAIFTSTIAADPHPQPLGSPEYVIMDDHACAIGIAGHFCDPPPYRPDYRISFYLRLWPELLYPQTHPAPNWQAFPPFPFFPL